MKVITRMPVPGPKYVAKCHHCSSIFEFNECEAIEIVHKWIRVSCPVCSTITVTTTEEVLPH